MENQTKDPNGPASKAQTFALFCATGKDFRNLNLTYGVAHELLSAVQPYRGDKTKAFQIVSDLLAGKLVMRDENAKETRCPQKETFRELFDRAQAAGLAAGNAAVPTPMFVGSPSTPLGDDIDENKAVYFVPEGVCGFASVIIRPGTCAFARWLTKNDLAHKHYYGGVCIWIHEHGQSMTRKEAHAREMARIFRDAGIDAHCESRMD